TNVQLTLITSNPFEATGTWRVTATLSDNQTLGIAAFSIDVTGSSDADGSVTILNAATVSQTLQASNPPYSQFRSTGTLSGTDLLGVSAAQPLADAQINNDPSILRFGDGLVTAANSSVYGQIVPNGPLTLATGRWIGTGVGGFMQARLTPGSGFNLFPLNYAVDDGNYVFNPPPPGTVQDAPFAANVFASTRIFVNGPEPTSLVLFFLGGVALLGVARRRYRELTGTPTTGWC